MRRAVTVSMLMLSFALVGATQECGTVTAHVEPAECVKVEHVVYGPAAEPWLQGAERVRWMANGGAIREKNGGLAECRNTTKWIASRDGRVSYTSYQQR